MAKLTNVQKRELVAAVMSQVGNIAEFWSELAPKGIPYSEGREYLATLMRRMPFDAWDIRLGPADQIKGSDK